MFRKIDWNKIYKESEKLKAEAAEQASVKTYASPDMEVENACAFFADACSSKRRSKMLLPAADAYADVLVNLSLPENTDKLTARCAKSMVVSALLYIGYEKSISDIDVGRLDMLWAFLTTLSPETTDKLYSHRVFVPKSVKAEFAKCMGFSPELRINTCVTMAPRFKHLCIGNFEKF